MIFHLLKPFVKEFDLGKSANILYRGTNENVTTYVFLGACELSEGLWHWLQTVNHPWGINGTSFQKVNGYLKLPCLGLLALLYFFHSVILIFRICKIAVHAEFNSCTSNRIFYWAG